MWELRPAAPFWPSALGSPLGTTAADPLNLAAIFFRPPPFFLPTTSVL